MYPCLNTIVCKDFTSIIISTFEDGNLIEENSFSRILLVDTLPENLNVQRIELNFLRKSLDVAVIETF